MSRDSFIRFLNFPEDMESKVKQTNQGVSHQNKDIENDIKTIGEYEQDKIATGDEPDYKKTALDGVQ